MPEIERFYRGEIDAIRDDHLAYVLGLWRALPDRERVAAGKAREAAKKKEKIELTLEIRAQLCGHWMRVGLSVDAFFARQTNPPSRLSRRMILRWISSDDAPRRVRRDHLEFVLAAWEKLPDGLGRARSIHFIPFAYPHGSEL